MKKSKLIITITLVLVIGIVAVFLFNQFQTSFESTKEKQVEEPTTQTEEKPAEESEQPLPIEGWGELEKIIQVEGEEWPSFTLKHKLDELDRQAEKLKKDIQIYGDPWNPVIITFEVKVPDDVFFEFITPDNKSFEVAFKVRPQDDRPKERKKYDVFLVVKDYLESVNGGALRELPMKEIKPDVWVTKFRAPKNSELLYRYNLEGVDSADEIVNGDENAWRPIKTETEDIFVQDEVKEWRWFTIESGFWEPYKPLDRIIKSGVDTIRLANHEFMPVGETRKFGDIGNILETMQFSNEEKIKVDAESQTVTCLKGGVACIRAQYREDPGTNDVQTKCIVCIDETGSCKNEEKVSFDFEQYFGFEGEANWLESGDNLFYGVCRIDRKIRLQQTPQKLPKLYFAVSDCYGGGGACLDFYEYPWIRKGTITTFSGKTLKTNWIIQNNLAIKAFSIDRNGEVVVSEAVCELGCTLEKTLFQEGDILVTEGLAPSSYEEYIDKIERESPERLQKLLERHGITKFKLTDLDNIDAGVKEMVFSRMINLEFNGFTLHYLDKTHKLREKNVIIALSPSGQTIGVICNEPLCKTIEEELMKAEKSYIEKLRQEGFSSIWGHYPITDSTILYLRPHPTNFDGILLTPVTDALGKTEEEATARIAEVMEGVTNEIKTQTPDIPVVLRFWGIEEVGLVGPCELEFCPTSFYYTFAFAEKTIDIFMKNLGEQFAGIGVGWFEGGHFDIRQPVEPKYGYFHNMVTHTGYNNPILNIYASQ